MPVWGNKIVNKLIAIVGPTGIGKTRLAIELAQKYCGEIVNADSRQVYKFMTIGIAKPTAEQQLIVPHHLIDIISPNEDFSLSEYQKLAYRTVEDIQQRGKLPFLVGGSGQYVWAVLEGWVIPKIAPDLQLRHELQQKAAAGMGEQLYKELIALDPRAAKIIDPRNIRRVVRALEVNRQYKGLFSELRQKQTPSFTSLIIGLTIDRKALYRRVDARIDLMLSSGFVDEVKNLLSMGYRLELPAMSSIGYREIGQYLEGKLTLDEAIYRIKTGTHRFIRAQYTWFRLDDERIKWFDVDKVSEHEISKVVDGWVSS